MSLPANSAGRAPEPMLAGSVLPIQRAEELLATLPGVISARIVAAHNGAVDEIHLLTTTEVAAKQTVRNVESALIAHLGMRVSHKKISVATSDDPSRPIRSTPMSSTALPPPAPSLHTIGPATVHAGHTLHSTPVVSISPAVAAAAPVTMDRVTPIGIASNRRRIYFEHVEVRRSRANGITCRVTLRKGDETFIGEAEGMEHERIRIELAARATLAAMRQAELGDRQLGFEGCKTIDAFDHEFVFVGVTQRHGRETTLTTGSAEVRESQETAGVLAVLDATNRWLDR
ncbi:MAG: hypothetical protein ABI442_04640 [Gemmatimonadaceae bacterium]